VIAFNRPGGSEAVAGKNPLSHVGKIHNVVADRLARRIHTEVPDIRQVTIWLSARIGAPVDAPQVVSVEVSTALPIEEIGDAIRNIIVVELIASTG
jgi:S-adenosylmethionine synthetase